jgi:hypothetical protein
MNLRNAILEKHSKAQKDKIVKWVGNNQERFDQLFKLFIHDKDEIITQRAGWPLSYIVEAHPALIQKHFRSLLRNLEKQGLHNAIKRNSIRLLQDLAIPERFQGEIMNICFAYITDPQEKPAIKTFSLTVLHKLARQYPEIKNELKVIIESQWDNESTAFKSRARKILKELS